MTTTISRVTFLPPKRPEPERAPVDATAIADRLERARLRSVAARAERETRRLAAAHDAWHARNHGRRCAVCEGDAA